MKSNSIISPYYGNVALGSIEIKKDCIEEFNDESSCEKKLNTSDMMIIKFKFHYQNGWAPVSLSTDENEVPIKDYIERTDTIEELKDNPLSLYFKSFNNLK